MAERTPPPTSLLWEHIKETNESLKVIREDLGDIRVQLAEKPCALHSQEMEQIKADVQVLENWRSSLWMKLAALGTALMAGVQIVITWVMGK